MSDQNMDSLSGPIINFNSAKAAPTILTFGALLLRVLAWWENINFILSIREEKVAMILQLLLDWGWLIFAIVGIVWALGANEIPKDSTKVHWGMVTAVGILSFMLGTFITVRAAGSMPLVLSSYGGDPTLKNCSAIVDTSRLVGRKDKDRLILLCGVGDPSRDPIEDDRIAVSEPFTITGQAVSIVARYGAMEKALTDLQETISHMPQTANQNPAFALWHSVAVIPNDVNVSEIKKISDVAKRGGQVVTEPQAGAWANAMPVFNNPVVPPPVPLSSATPGCPSDKKP